MYLPSSLWHHGHPRILTNTCNPSLISLDMDPVAAKKLWNFLRVAFFMMRRGLVSKRKLMIMDMNLMMKRGKLACSKNLANIFFQHRHSPTSSPQLGPGFYEFSCSNTPNPVFLHTSSKRRHSYFPCIHATPTIDELEEAQAQGPPFVLPCIEYSPSPRCTYATGGLGQGDKRSPQLSPLLRISSCSQEEEEGEGSGQHVDAEAEEFIRRFYEQLRLQGRIGLLQYQEEEYQEMLARGT